MRSEALLVLAATVSSQEGRLIARTLKEEGLDARVVIDAEDADAEISAHPGPCVLVLDSGLLQMPRNEGWRTLGDGHGRLGIVVRCLIDRDPGLERTKERTFLVHPDNREGLLEAIRTLGGSDAAD